MAWYDSAVFYHIYPLGMTGAPKENTYGEPVHRLRDLYGWIDHIKAIGCNAIYIGPLFESVGHGYETTDYKKLDSRLGDNDDLKEYVRRCHEAGIRVIFDGVFNHTGRDFFAFRDIKEHRENARYKDWYCNVNFRGNNEYNDGFSYENWGGYNLLVKLNQKNPEVRDYICDVIRFWVSEFDVDGIRLDAADVLDFEFMQALRRTASEVKPEFWLMGEVIHGEYSRWANDNTLHSVTNYHLHKALYSGHNDQNYFEIAHTVKHLNDMGGNRAGGMKLYNFVDNHDVERIYTKLSNKANFLPVHVLLYTLPGIPSVYYGSEFAIEGHKYRGGSDDEIRPCLSYENYVHALAENPFTQLIAALGHVHACVPALSYGDYREVSLTTKQYVFTRNDNDASVIVSVNNDGNEAWIHCGNLKDGTYTGALFGETLIVQNGQADIHVRPNSGEIWVPETVHVAEEPVKLEAIPKSDVMSEGGKDVTSEMMEEIPTEVEPENSEEQTTGAIHGLVEKAVETIRESVEQAEKEMCRKEGTVESESKQHADPEQQDIFALAQRTDYENMSIEELQGAILGKMAGNGSLTDYMRRTVAENIYRDSLLNWVRSFR